MIIIAPFVALLLPTAMAAAVTNHCDQASTFVDGNHYCSAVERVSFMDVSFSGSYNRVTGMPEGGACTYAVTPISGPLAPFDEDMSLQLRGPLEFRQLAVYYPQSGSDINKREPHAKVGHTHVKKHQHDHGYHHLHPRQPKLIIETDVVTETDYITIDAPEPTIAHQATTFATSTRSTVTHTETELADCDDDGDDQTSSAVNTPHSSPQAPLKSTPSSLAVSISTTPSTVSTVVSESQQAPSKPASTVSPNGATGSWSRASYYNSDSKTSQNITFLNNMGGGKSGVFSIPYGASLSYASADGSTSAASSEVFGGKLSSCQELSVFSDTACTEELCGFSRPGAVTRLGFGGKNVASGQKLLLMEFKMPHDSVPCQAQQDIPAIWMLNGKITRTGEYTCNCWSSGCGELDIFEVLSSGNNKCISTMHAGQANTQGAGFPDYFDRPVDSFVKAAVLLKGSNIIFQMLPSDFDFSDNMSVEQIANIENPSVPGLKAASAKFN
ncbi:hypothetical protein BT63DRAFT_409371 [Microthyrium microscopicum]|uniref:glucan endo-1,3-beta-D-glucosidase n=1 Tax=Microthyrium microscopicum TaxID=703497 RepID=A0A6A6UTX8_9PEZI|nr:hypothetical protein BT63DRAFT_409371 [Microthyrium microscopicum]